MEKETIKVTINPDGVSCREVNPLGEKAPRYVPLMGGWEVMVTESDRSIHFREKLNRWNEAEATLRTFEIELEECTCKNNKMLRTIGYQQLCDKICTWVELEAGTTHTAEILETYPEIREGGIVGKVKILT